MSTRSLRKRLDRLTPTKSPEARENDSPPDFIVDPILAKSMLDDSRRIDELVRARPYRWPSKIEDQTEEERTLRARIVEKARTISCPANYGFNEALDDEARLFHLECNQKLPPWFSHLAKKIEDPDAEEAQLIAKTEAFRESPEGCARRRTIYLAFQDSRDLNSAEKSELEGLWRLYPETTWMHPKDPMKSAAEAWRDAAKKARAEERTRLEERALLRASKRPQPT